MTKQEALDYLHAKVKDDEPVFVLKANDRTAPKTVRQWAQNAKDAGCNNLEKLDEAMRCASTMEQWRSENGHGKVPD